MSQASEARTVAGIGVSRGAIEFYELRVVHIHTKKPFNGLSSEADPKFGIGDLPHERI